MKYLSIFTTLTLLIASSLEKEKQIPQVEIYIESLSPESISFILNSFVKFHSNPEHDKLATVNFLPYGNSTEFWKDSDLYFNCTRGDNECFGNLLLICGMHEMSGEFVLNFVICIESNIRDYHDNFVLTLQKCIRDENIGTHILSCARGRSGKRLMHDVGIKTKRHDHVPWIIFNGEHDVEIEKKIIENMLDYFCNQDGNTEIAGCSSTKSFNRINDN